VWKATPIVAMNLRRLRAAMEMSQAELGERVGLPSSLISRVERGTAKLTLGVLLTVTNIPGLSVADLFREVPNTFAFVPPPVPVPPNGNGSRARRR